MLLADRVRRVAADILETAPEDLHSDSSADTVGTWDSLRHLSLVLALEQEFEIEFTPEEIEELLSIGLVQTVVEEKLTAKKLTTGKQAHESQLSLRPV
ncbi:MAG: acyl carrier protein [Bryobacterales bacterium]|nr:acyl carrier protein [Bryobacterales bacterium]